MSLLTVFTEKEAKNIVSFKCFTKPYINSSMKYF